MTIVGATAAKSLRNGPSSKRTTRQSMPVVDSRCRASRKRTIGPPLRVASWLTRITWGRVPLGSQEARIIGRSKPIRFRARYSRHASCRIVVIPLHPGIEPVKSATLLPKFINSFFHYLTAEGNKRIPQDIVQLTTLQIRSAPTRTSRLYAPYQSSTTSRLEQSANAHALHLQPSIVSWFLFRNPSVQSILDRLVC